MIIEKELFLMVGPIGSGKTTFSKTWNGYRISQDEIVEKLEDQFSEVVCQIWDSRRTTTKALRWNDDGLKVTEERKRELGIHISQYKPEHYSAFWSMFLNNKDKLEQYVMKQIRPIGNMFNELY
jgi:energy-coupling factor transporter ATP-binding protein EcfA2